MENYSLTQQLKNYGISNIEVISQFTHEFGDKTNLSCCGFNYKTQIIDVKKQDDCTIVLFLMEKRNEELPVDDFRKETFVLLAVAAPSRRKYLFTGSCFFSSRLDYPVKYGGPGSSPIKNEPVWTGWGEAVYIQNDPITGKTPSGADSELDYCVRYGNYLKFIKIISARYHTDDVVVKEGYIVAVKDDGHEYLGKGDDGEHFVGEYIHPMSNRAKSILWIQEWKDWKWKHWEVIASHRAC